MKVDVMLINIQKNNHELLYLKLNIFPPHTSFLWKYFRHVWSNSPSSDISRMDQTFLVRISSGKLESWTQLSFQVSSLTYIRGCLLLFSSWLWFHLEEHGKNWQMGFLSQRIFSLSTIFILLIYLREVSCKDNPTF